jgi:DNA-binding NtrC family response regulator
VLQDLAGHASPPRAPIEQAPVALAAPVSTALPIAAAPTEEASTPLAGPELPAVGALAPAIRRDILPLWQVERDAIEEAIAQHDGNVPRAAAALGISPSTIYRKRQAWSAPATQAAGERS